VARRMGLSEGTVRTHLNHIYERLGVTSRTAAVSRARRAHPDYNVVGAPVAGSFGVVADDVELVEPGMPESVNESTWS
jgi:hypothetical protein